MPSVHRVPNSPYWYASFYKPDGRRTLRSTGSTHKRKALGIALEWDRASKIGREGRLTVKRTRDTMAAVYAIANNDQLPDQSTREFLTGWLKEKEDTVAERSLVRYAGIIDNFLAHLGGRANEPMDMVTRDDVLRFRNARKKRVAPGTVNAELKVVGIAWNQALREKIISENVLREIDPMDSGTGAGSKTRAFTLKEIKRILAVATDEWRGIILTALYTGMRLGDVAALVWRSVDLAERSLNVRTRKTGRTVDVPLAKPLHSFLMALDVPDDPETPVFPGVAGLTSSTLSNQFTGILAAAGLAEKKAHRATGKGRGAQRERNPLSFHSLRHTATSWLKNAGVSDAIARDIIGHESAAISRVYTHMDPEAKRNAVDRLPDVT